LPSLAEVQRALKEIAKIRLPLSTAGSAAPGAAALIEEYTRKPLPEEVFCKSAVEAAEAWQVFLKVNLIAKFTLLTF
jgi:hypothetical protein